jgi:hypothetical protein
MLWIHWAIVEECWVNSIWDYSFCILWIFFSCKFIPHLSIPPSTLNIIDLKVEKCRKIKSYKIMELDGKFRNKSFCCIKGPKCGSSHFFLHLSLLQKYYTHIYTCTLKIILISFCILWIFFSCKFIPHLSIPPSTLNIIDLKVEKCRKIKSYKIIRELLFVWQVFICRKFWCWNVEFW